MTDSMSAGYDPKQPLPQQDFLGRYIFRGCSRRRVHFDAEAVAHFRAEDFLQVLERCDRFGVEVFGIEIFTSAGAMVLVEISQGPSALDFMPIVVRFCERDDITVSGTFGVPDSLLDATAVSDDLVKAYSACNFQVQIKGQTVPVRVGKTCPLIQTMLIQRKLPEAFVITAANPFSKKRAAQLNGIQNNILRERVERRRWTNFPSRAAGGTAWQEEGLLVVGPNADDILELGIEFGQNSVIRIPSKGAVELLLLR